MLEIFTIGVNGKRVTVFVGSDATRIVDSHLIKGDADKGFLLSEIRKAVPEAFGERKDRSLIREWKAHNILYKIGYERARTKDVDLERKQGILLSIGYAVLSMLSE